MECITRTTLRGHCEYAWWNHFQNIIPSLNRVIKQVFPCFIRAPSDSNAKPIDQLYGGKEQMLLQLDNNATKMLSTYRLQTTKQTQLLLESHSASGHLLVQLVKQKCLQEIYLRFILYTTWKMHVNTLYGYTVCVRM